MSYSHDKIDTKVQEIIFRDLLTRPENMECADCSNKQPTWTSIDFGVFLCIRCSGVHRKLGPHITRVRSTKLDSWKQDILEIIYSTGNKISNDFYEFRLPTGFKKLDENASDKECTKFVNDKYIKKSFSPPNYPDPVKEFKQNKKDKSIFINFDKLAEELADKFKKQSKDHHHKQHIEITNEARPVRKKSLTLEDESNKAAQKQQTVDFDDPFHHKDKKEEPKKDTFTFDWNFDMNSVNAKQSDNFDNFQDSTTTQKQQVQQQPQQQQQTLLQQSFDFNGTQQKTQQTQQTQQVQQQTQQTQQQTTQQSGGFDVMKLYGQGSNQKQEDKWSQLNNLYGQSNQQQFGNQFGGQQTNQFGGQQQNLFGQQQQFGGNNQFGNQFGGNNQFGLQQQQGGLQQLYQQQGGLQQQNLYNQQNFNQLQQNSGNLYQQSNNFGYQQQQGGNLFGGNNQFGGNSLGGNQSFGGNQNSFGYGNNQSLGGNNFGNQYNQNQFSQNQFGGNQNFGNNQFGNGGNKNYQTSNDLF